VFRAWIIGGMNSSFFSKNDSWVATFHFFAENNSIASIQWDRLPADPGFFPQGWGPYVTALYIPPSPVTNDSLHGMLLL
jgi:hypothetical protein